MSGTGIATGHLKNRSTRAVDRFVLLFGTQCNILQNMVEVVRDLCCNTAFVMNREWAVFNVNEWLSDSIKDFISESLLCSSAIETSSITLILGRTLATLLLVPGK